MAGVEIVEKFVTLWRERGGTVFTVRNRWPKFKTRGRKRRPIEAPIGAVAGNAVLPAFFASVRKQRDTTI